MNKPEKKPMPQVQPPSKKTDTSKMLPKLPGDGKQIPLKKLLSK